MATVPQSDEDTVYVYTCKDADGQLVEFASYGKDVYDMIFDEDDWEDISQIPLYVQRGDDKRTVELYFIEELTGFSMRDWERKIDASGADLAPVTLKRGKNTTLRLWEIIPG